jgi:hypothetical protein
MFPPRVQLVKAAIVWGILAASAVSCRAEDRSLEDLSEPAAPGAGRPGMTVRATHYSIVASELKDCPPGEHHSRGGDRRRVGVEIWLEPTGSIQVPANPYYAKLIDGEGNVHEATLGGCGTPLGPTLPARGRPARGWIVFDVPRAARDFTLVYTPELVRAPIEEVIIVLTSKTPSPSGF